MSKPHRKQKVNSQPRLESYDALKTELEQETQHLLRQRNLLSQRYGIEPSQHTITEQSRMQEESYSSTFPKTVNPHEEDRRKRIKTKIEEVINMCKQDRQSAQEGGVEYTPVVEAEKQILDYLSGEPKPTFPPNPYPGVSEMSPHQVSESNPHTFQAKSQKSSIRQQLKQNPLLGDDAMEMIEEIERKALVEIQHLRGDKIQLMRTLNEEIKQHNEQKKRSLALQGEVRRLKEELARYINERKMAPPNHAPQQAVSQMISRKPSEHMPPMEQPSPPPIRERGLESEMRRLEEENAYLKQMMNQPPQTHQHFYPQRSHPIVQSTQMQPQQLPFQPQSSYLPNHNQQLRAQLATLEGKIKNYETVMRAYETGQGSQLDYLLAEGHEISEEGKKLLRIKSKPEFRKQGRRDFDAEEKEKQQYFAELKYLKKKIHSLEEENQYLQHRGKHPESPSHSYILSSRQNRSPTYPTSQYEKVINQMKRASHI